jgi:hypothetical protein
VVVDLACDGRHDSLLLFARGVIETFRDPRMIEAEITGQDCRRRAEVVRCELLQAKQRTDAVAFVPRSAAAITLRFIGWAPSGLAKTYS